jgi:hypothetical protein
LFVRRHVATPSLAGRALNLYFIKAFFACRKEELAPRRVLTDEDPGQSVRF